MRISSVTGFSRSSVTPREMLRLSDSARLGGLLFIDAAALAAADGAEESSSTEALVDAPMQGREPVGCPLKLIDHTGARRTDAEVPGDQEGGLS